MNQTDEVWFEISRGLENLAVLSLDCFVKLALTIALLTALCATEDARLKNKLAHVGTLNLIPQFLWVKVKRME